MTVRLIDGENQPVAAASVGQFASGESGAEPRWRFYRASEESNVDGVATLRLPGMPARGLLLYALHEDRKLAGFVEVSPDNDLPESVDIALAPACRVSGRITSSELNTLDRDVEWTNVYVFYGEHRPLSFNSEQQEFEFYLPAGEYRLQAYGTHLENLRRDVEVLPGQEELDLGALDLPADRLAKLIGKPAPELQQIKAWHNGGPITLAELRGNVVVLDFWGHWCGPCVYAMPALMSLHDDYYEDGLVIVGVHDDSLPDAAALQEQLTRLRDQSWRGRDIPFAIALDGGGPTPIEGTEIKARGATTAAYGITAFPTAVLIDREGNVVDEFHARSPESVKLLKQLLGIESIAEANAASTVPGWKRRFDAVYGLAPAEVVKRIPPPFIPERMQFVTRATAYEGLGAAPERLVIFSENANAFTDATLAELLRVVASPASHEVVFECPPDVKQLNIEGDWLIRPDSPLEDRVAALESILASETDLRISFEPNEIMRDTIVVTGRYRFRPLPGSEGSELINVTANEADLTSEAGGGSGTADEFFNWLSRFVERPFAVESDPGTPLQLVWRQRESSIASFRVDKPPKLGAILANLEKQTGLAFDRQPRPTRVWHVKQLGDPAQP